jgi:hypothetical protein
MEQVIATAFLNILSYTAGNIDVLSLKKRWSPVYRDQLIAKYGTSKEELVAFFGKVRDDLINENLDAWVSLNQVMTSSFVNLSTKTQVLCLLDV